MTRPLRFSLYGVSKPPESRGLPPSSRRENGDSKLSESGGDQRSSCPNPGKERGSSVSTLFSDGCPRLSPHIGNLMPLMRQIAHDQRMVEIDAPHGEGRLV